MLERDLWAVFKRWFPGRAQRVEATMPLGLPDVHWTLLTNGQRLSGWVELKLAEQRSSGVWLPKMRLEQACWLRQYSEGLGRCCILAMLPSSMNNRYFVLRGDYRGMFKKAVPEGSIVWSGVALDEAALRALTET